MLKKKTLPFLIICMLAILLIIFCPISSLDKTGNRIIAVTFVTIASWILKPWNISSAATGLFLMGAALLLGIEPGVAFSGFSQGTVWTLIPALFFGLALQKTGLGKRIAMLIFSILPVSWPSVLLSWGIIGILLSLVTPSMTVRVSIMLPIALNCCELFQLKKGSNNSSLLLIYSIIMAILPGAAWLTGSLTGPMIQGVYETIPELASVITFQSWLHCAIVPIITATILTALLMFLFLKPEERLQSVRLEKEHSPLSKQEVITGIVLIGCCILFFTGTIHKIPNTTICLFAVVIFFAAQVLDAKDFMSGINWDLIVFIGSGLSMSRIFAVSGISDWLSSTLSVPFKKMCVHPVMFLFVILVLLFVWRFLDITTLIPTMVILAPIIVIVSEVSPIAPVIWTVIFSLAICSMFLSYTNMWIFMGRQMAGNYAWTEGQLFRAGTAYFIASLMALAITIPVWIKLGLLAIY